MIYTIVRKDKSDNINAVISFDSVTSLDESWSATVTSQTVEYGFNVTDNINIEAPSYSISAIISSYSLFNIDRELVWDGADFKSEAKSDNYSHVAARDKIIKVFSDRSLVTLIESEANSNNENIGTKYTELKSGYHKEIDNCVISSLSITHPSGGTGAFYVTMTLQKIVMANIEIGVLSEGENRRAIQTLGVTFKEESSKSKKEDGSDTSESNTPNAADEEFSETVGKGNYDEMREKNRRDSGVTQLEDDLKALKQSEYDMATSGIRHEPTNIGGNLLSIERGEAWRFYERPK
jgi:hypothetical protein